MDSAGRLLPTCAASPMARHLRKRLVKSQKGLVRDGGLVHALLVIADPEALLAGPIATHRRNVVSGNCGIHCANSSLPWFIDHLREVVPRKVAEPVRAVQIETQQIGRLRVVDQHLTARDPQNLGTLLPQP